MGERNGGGKHERKSDIGFNWINGSVERITNTNRARRTPAFAMKSVDILCIHRTLLPHSREEHPLFLFLFIE